MRVKRNLHASRISVFKLSFYLAVKRKNDTVMKKLIALLLIVVSLAGCEKDHCIYYTNVAGTEMCCEKCFRSERKLEKFVEDHLNYQGDRCDLCD